MAFLNFKYKKITHYNNINIRLLDSQLVKLKEAKNVREITLRLSTNMFNTALRIGTSNETLL